MAAAGTGVRPPQGATGDRRGADAVRPTHQYRRRSHRRDVPRRRQLLDPLRLDQASVMEIAPCEMPAAPSSFSGLHSATALKRALVDPVTAPSPPGTGSSNPVCSSEESATNRKLI